MGSTKEFPDQPKILKMLLAGKYSQVGLLNTSTLCHLLHIPPADSKETVRWKMEKTKLSKEKQNKKRHIKTKRWENFKPKSTIILFQHFVFGQLWHLFWPCQVFVPYCTHTKRSSSSAMPWHRHCLFHHLKGAPKWRRKLPWKTQNVQTVPSAGFLWLFVIYLWKTTFFYFKSEFFRV